MGLPQDGAEVGIHRQARPRRCRLVRQRPNNQIGLCLVRQPDNFRAGVAARDFMDVQVAIELLNMMAGVKIAIVPFKGGTTQITAELAGDIPVGM